MIPDFYVVGATRAGTTSLHYILEQHPDIYASEPKELRFLDRDALNVRYFMLEYPDEWLDFDWGRRKDELLNEYEQYFQEAEEGQKIFEATQYMYSQKSIERIHRLNKDAKLVFMLRNPVNRAYSHYWHLVRSGRAIYSFENQIRFESPNILELGIYRNFIKQCMDIFPREQLKFIIFEEFVSDMQKQIDFLLDFLGIENGLDLNKIDTHKNPSQVPRLYRTHLVFNWFVRQFMGKRFTNNVIENEEDHRNRLSVLLEKGFKRLNLAPKKYPPMKPQTRKLLEEYYRRENRGLSDLIDKPLSQYWPYMDD